MENRNNQDQLQNDADKVIKVALLGTYLPRKCGIATFTTDLYQAISRYHQVVCDVIAINEQEQQYDYPPQVCQQIDANNVDDYRQLAQFLNQGDYDVLCVQHEYGIFGGHYGNLLIELLACICIPVVTTLHTVLAVPNQAQKKVLQQVAKYSRCLIVMSDKASQLLIQYYQIPAVQIHYIPHGVPDIPYRLPSSYKKLLGYKARAIILTFGLLSPGKGVEDMLEVLLKIANEVPNVLYLVIGQAHPGHTKFSGEDYAEILQRKAAKLGVEQYFHLHNQFVSFNELTTYLGAADIYVTPYSSQEQIVSGTLSYAKAMGTPLVSTPYWYAEELITSDSNGVLVAFKDKDGLAKAILTLLKDDEHRHRISLHNHRSSRNMIWEQVGKDYIQQFNQVINLFSSSDAAMTSSRYRHACLGQQFITIEKSDLAKKISLQYLQVMTDDTGMLQHAVYNIPDRNHGYCADDNARALMVMVKIQQIYPQREDITRLIRTYLAFIHSAFNDEQGKFRNFMGYDRRWLEDVGSDDCQGRILWALASVIEDCQNEQHRKLAQTLFLASLQQMVMLNSPRTMALNILAMDAYLKVYPQDKSVLILLEKQADQLLMFIQDNLNASLDWQWFEPELTYANARIPQALLTAGKRLSQAEMSEHGFKLLNFLVEIQFNHPLGDFFVPIGNRGWCDGNGHRAYFDQQAIEAQTMIEVCLLAHQLTQEAHWFDLACRCLGWFLGDNLLNRALVELNKGSCYDGLEANGINENQGAESTLAWLLSLLAFIAH